jgi:anti-anti-sigma regulatory factor
MKKEVQKLSLLLASTVQQLEKLCQQDPKCIMHWIQNEKSGNLLLEQSQGRLETLRRYIDTDISPTYTAEGLDHLLEQVQHQRVMVISDTAGMAKITLLTHLSKQIKQKIPAIWVVRIDLNDHTEALKALREKQIDNEKAIGFLSEKVLKHMSGFEVELFKQGCEQSRRYKLQYCWVVLMKSVRSTSRLTELLQALLQMAAEQLCVNIRPHVMEELEDKLQQLSYTLELFLKKIKLDS